MYRTRGLERLLGSAVIVGVVLAVYLILEVVDRLTASRAMRAHVNDGSEKFFRERGTIWQAAVRATTTFLGSIGARWF